MIVTKTYKERTSTYDEFQRITNAIRTYYRGDLFYADLGDGLGSEQKWIRPVVIIQNDMGNRHSPTVIISAITSEIKKMNMPTHVGIELKKQSQILLEQVRTIDKSRLKEKIGHLNEEQMKLVDEAILVSLGLKNNYARIENKIEDKKNLVCDFSKIKNLTVQIKYLERFIIHHKDNLYKIKNQIDELNTSKGELINYCKKQSLDYTKFYKPELGIEELYNNEWECASM